MSVDQQVIKLEKPKEVAEYHHIEQQLKACRKKMRGAMRCDTMRYDAMRVVCWHGVVWRGNVVWHVQMCVVRPTPFLGRSTAHPFPRALTVLYPPLQNW
jgi:homogentisate 1,2-dioxygenase